jgi:hypothetical protein
MEKPMLTALLFLCTPLSFFASPASFYVALPAPFATADRPSLSAPALCPGSAPVLYPHAVIPSDTAAPITTTLVLPASHNVVRPAGTIPALPPARIPVTIRIFNNSPRDLSGIVLEWELQVNGIARQKGTIVQLLIAPQHTGLARLPVKIPNGAGEEAFLQVRYRSRKKEPLIPGGRIIAEDQLLLKTWDGSNLSVSPVGELTFRDEDGIFTIQSPAIGVRFDKQTGWLQQYEVKGFRMLADSPALTPNFWRPSEHAGDSGRPRNDTAVPPSPEEPWQQVTRAPRLQLFSTSTGSGIVIVRTEYLLPETSCHLHLSYTINATGEMQVEQSIEADSAQKGSPLPRFGMQWPLPPGLDSIAWYGPGPAAIGIYRQSTSEQGPAPAPRTEHATVSDPRREPPMATAVRWWTITGRDGKGLRVTADSSLLDISATSPTSLNIDYRPTAPEDPATPAGPARPPSGLPYGNYRYSYKITPLIP